MRINFNTERWSRYLQRIGRNPEADWRLLFSCFIVLATLLLAFSGVMLYRINVGEIFLAEKKDSGTLRTIDRDKLKELTQKFKLSDRQFEALKAEKPGLVDPGV